ICWLATLIAFLMVFHQLSLSGAWLTRTKRSPSAAAGAATPANMASDAASVRMVFFICSSLYSEGGSAHRLAACPLAEPYSECIFYYLTKATGMFQIRITIQTTRRLAPTATERVIARVIVAASTR